MKIRAYFNNLFWLFLTYLLSPYFYFRIFLKKGRSKPSKILIIQTAKIGDMVCSTPVFREIKKKFPNCHLTALIIKKTRDVLKNNPHLDEVLLLDDYSKFKLIQKLQQDSYDWVLNLLPGAFTNIIGLWSFIPNRAATTHKGAGEIIGLLSIFNNYRLEFQSHTRFTKHYLNLLKFLGIEQSSEEKEIFVLLEEERKTLDFLTRNNLSADDLLIGISAVPGNKIKQWDLSKFAALADLLVEKKGAKIIFIGSANDIIFIEKVKNLMQNSSIDTSGFFKLSELPALLKKLKLFISVDSGPLYIANALGTPVIDIGGSYDIQEQAPSGNKCKVLQKYPMECSFILPLTKECMEKHQRGLKEITPEEVFEAVQSLLNQS